MTISDSFDPYELMRLAVAKAQEGIAAGQSPFGCAIALGGRLLACTHNTVLASLDVTAHAEVNALRAACLAAGNVLLPGALVASTCEPCPMCMAALHWARVSTVYYGATIADAAAAGFNEMHLAARELVQRSRSPVELVPGIRDEECRALFAQWGRTPSARAY